MDQVSKSLKKLTRILDTMLQIFLIQKRKIITNTLPLQQKGKIRQNDILKDTRNIFKLKRKSDIIKERKFENIATI